MKKLGLIALLIMAPLALMAETICAVVKIEIRQEVSFERQAFDAKMVITNGLETIDLRDLGINVIFRDQDGNPVVASSDPNSSGAKFFITVDRIEGVENATGGLVFPEDANDILSDATAVIPAGARAEIHWLIIPTEHAVADGNKIGEMYGVGANVSYTFGEESQTVEVAPDYIEVRPTPSLELDYFLPADVFGNDPNTAATEPVEPFDLGLRIKNNGDGEAANLKIESAQPKIIDNDQGLLIDFLILGTSVNDQPVIPSLLADIGDLQSEENAMVSWQMTSSLTGEFVEFTADFVHSDDLGGELTSVIESPIDTHTLLHRVLVDETGRDSLRDFLAMDEDFMRVYESDGMDVDVAERTPTVVNNGIINDRRQYTITVSPFSGPGYATWSDDYQGVPQLMTLIRNSDNKVLPSENIWQYKEETSPGTYQYSMAMFDSNGGGDYTLIVDGLVPNALPVVTVQSPQLGYVDNLMSFDIVVTDADSGDVLTLTPISMPSGAGLTVISPGIWQFNWTPTLADEGDHNVSLRASDGTADVDINILLTISQQDPNDTDGDGLLDAWEMEHFGDLDEDGTGDFDQDSATNLQEHDHGGDPTSEDRPQAVEILTPAAGAHISTVPVDFMVVNSVGAVDAAMVYEFEIYEGSLQHLYMSETITESELSTTAWTHGQVFAEDVRYIWRVRAFDGVTYSTWAYDEFFYSTVDDAPAHCALDYPVSSEPVNEPVVELAVTEAIDPDSDALQYRFEVFTDAALTSVVADSDWLNASGQHIRSWVPYTEFVADTTYYWTAKVTDGNTEVLCASSQFSTGINVPVFAVYQLSEPVNNGLTPIDLDLVVDAADTTVIEFELDVQRDFSSPQLQSGTVAADNTGQAIWSVTGLDHDTVYYWRVKGVIGASTRYGRWEYGQFTTQTLDGTPTVQMVNPAHQSWVTTRTPELAYSIEQFAGFADTFQVDVYEDAEATILLDSQVIDSKTFLTPLLNDRAHYFWQVKGLHADGSETVFTPLNQFFVIDDLVDEVPGFEFISLQEDESTASSNYRIQWSDSDADSDASISLYYDVDNSGADGVLITAGLSEDGVDYFDWDVSALAGQTLYIYAEITDASSTVVTYSLNRLRIDASAIEVLAVDNLVDESGGAVTVNVTLTQQPEDYVIIPVGISDDSEISIDTDSLMFNRSNWLTPQAITVTGIDDTLIDGDQTVYVQFGAVNSADPVFANTTISDLSIINVDDDIPGVLFTALAGVGTTEAGDAISFEVSLLAQPQADVTVNLVSSDETEGLPSVAQLLFNAANWDVPQVLVITGQDDFVVDGDVAYQIITNTSSSDANYEGLAIDPLDITNTDDDQAGVNVVPTGGLLTTEAGGTAAFEITLASEPVETVNLTLVSSDESEGTLDVASLQFTALNWDQAQTITVTGQDDPLVDGDVAYLVSLSSSSLDANYEALVISDISLTNQDDDVVDLIINPLAALQTSEAGGSVNVALSLNAQPNADVSVTLASSDTSEGDVSPTVLVFNSSNWNSEQTFTITGQDDPLIDGDQSYQVNVTVSSTDTDFDGLSVPAIDVVNTDDDVAGVVVTPTSGLTTTEAGGTASFSVVLSSEPEFDVTVTYASDDSTEGVASTALVFTPANWQVAQDMVITGVDDTERDGDVAYTLTGSVSSSDSNYQGLSIDQVSVTNTDDEVAQIGFVALSDLQTSEDGTLEALFRVGMSVEPTADVVLDFNVSDSTEGQVTPVQMTFTPSNWNSSQLLTVTGLDDNLIDYDIDYEVSYVITSTDSEYASLVPEIINLVNLDDDVPQQIDVFYTDADSNGAQAACNAAAAAVSEPDEVCVPSELGDPHPHWSYNGFLRWPQTNGIDYHATYYYGVDCPVGSYLDTDKGCVNEDDQGLQSLSPLGEGGGAVLAKSINVATGNHYLNEPLIDLGSGLKFGLSYNSHAQVDTFGEPQTGLLGYGWTHDFNRSVSAAYYVDGVQTIDVTRPDGRVYKFSKVNAAWVANNHVKSQLSQTVQGWMVKAKNGDVENYDALGRLINVRLSTGEYLTLTHSTKETTITNEFNQSITIGYKMIDAKPRVIGVADHTKRVWMFNYINGEQLSSITYPGAASRTFHYENSTHTGLITGITDQRGIRYSTYGHDAKGRIVSSELANGVNQLQIAYVNDNDRTLTNSLSNISSITVEKSDNLWQLKSFSGYGCSACEYANADFVYDANNNLLSKTIDGVVTTYGGYDSKGQNAYDIVGNEIRTDYVYDARFFGKPVLVSKPSVWLNLQTSTSYSYNDLGQMEVSISSGFEADGSPISKAIVNAYNGPFGQISETDGSLPGLSDQVLYTYYASNNAVETRRNRLKRVTGAEGIIERNHIRWSETGQVTEEQRPNGITINHVYDVQDRLLSTTQTDGVKSMTTQFSYLPTGQLETVTEHYGTPEASTLTFTYDDALRLTRVTDESVSRVDFILDTEGNLLTERNQDLAGNIRKQITRAYDSYNLLDSQTQSGVTVDYSFGSTGVLGDVVNGNGVKTKYFYDSLKRLTSITQNFQLTEPHLANVTTSFTYDAGDRVNSVTDGRGNATTYTYDDFGNMTAMDSPDSGVRSYVYNEAGQLLSQTDARGITSNMSYDGRNRITAIDYIDNSLDVTFTYDQGANGINQLTSFTDQSGSTTLSYDAFGNLLSKQQVVNGFDAATYAGFNDINQTMTYDDQNRLSTMTYPSGLTLSYEYDELGQVERISTTVDGLSVTVADQVKYLPFDGPVQAINFGNGVNYSATYDTGYRLSSYTYGNAISADFTYDGNHNITNIVRETVVNNDSFDYDVLDRLEQDNTAGPTEFGYDTVGNRVSYRYGGQPTIPYTIDSFSNRIINIGKDKPRVYDANGNLLNQKESGDYIWTYSQANRMSQFNMGSIIRGKYYYNAVGERVHKTHNKTTGALAGEFLYLYDQQGRIIHVSKYKNGNHLWDRETIWLGDRPVAQVRKFYSSGVLSTDDIYYIQADHQDAPRWITDDAGTRIWSLESDAFGTSSPVIDVDGDGSNFHFYLRSSGQYFDGESGLHHSYYRDYEPQHGKFLQSDPMGLNGDINTYEYANSSPVRYTYRSDNWNDPAGACYGLWQDLEGDCRDRLYPVPPFNWEAISGKQPEVSDWWQD